MRFVEIRAKNVFIKACSNLCEIEHVKEYDVEMNVKNEHKVIKLKDSVLREYIAKQAKETPSNLRNQAPATEKKKLLDDKPAKSGSLTARPKSGSSTGLTPTSKRDNFLVSSLISAQERFPKWKKKVVLNIVEKIVDKFCNCNFENFNINSPKEDKYFASQ